MDKNKHGNGQILEGPTFGRLNIKIDKQDSLDKQIMKDDLNSEQYYNNEKGQQTMRLNSSTMVESPDPTIRIYSTPDPFET